MNDGIHVEHEGHSQRINRTHGVRVWSAAKRDAVSRLYSRKWLGRYNLPHRWMAINTTDCFHLAQEIIRGCYIG
jgi:hypothetical protein